MSGNGVLVFLGVMIAVTLRPWLQVWIPDTGYGFKWSRTLLVSFEVIESVACAYSVGGI